MAGIPTVVVTRSGFEGIVANAFSGFGFPSEGPIGYAFPSEMFLVDSDLTPLEENFDKLMEGLTSWEPNMKETGMVEPEPIVVKGSDYIEAYANVNHLFSRNLWADSLAITPPTQELVDWILTGTEMDPDEVLGKVLPRSGVATVRSVAVALAMAGGRPEYLPVGIAMTQILVDEQTNTQSWSATTNSCFPVFVINGPIGRQIRLGSGYGLLGADSTHPAGAILGRMSRLILQDIGGAIPGTGTMALFGGMRHTNVVIAEDEEGIPESWTSLAEEKGFDRTQNVVSFDLCNGMNNVLWDFGGAETNLKCLTAMAGFMDSPNANRFDGPLSNEFSADPNRGGGIVLLPRAFVEALQNDNGFTKEDVKQFLWDNSQVPYDDVVATGHEAFVERGGVWKEGDMLACSTIPDQIKIVVCGGDQGGHGYWMPPMVAAVNPSIEIQLPSNWDDLLFQAEIDLGPIPQAH